MCQNYFAIPPAEQIAALSAFSLSPDTGDIQWVPTIMTPYVIVTDDMLIALRLAHNIVNYTACLALIDKGTYPNPY